MAHASLVQSAAQHLITERKHKQLFSRTALEQSPQNPEASTRGSPHLHPCHCGSTWHAQALQTQGSSTVHTTQRTQPNTHLCANILLVGSARQEWSLVLLHRTWRLHLFCNQRNRQTPRPFLLPLLPPEISQLTNHPTNLELRHQ